MSFYDEVRAAMKSKEQIASEQKALEEQKEIQGLNNTADLIFEKIKEDIVKQSSLGEYSNGKITGIVNIPYRTKGWNDDNLPSDYCIIADVFQRSQRHGLGIFEYRDVHKNTVEIVNLPKVLQVHSILLKLCQAEGITITEPFLHVIVRAKKKHQYQDVKQDYCIPIKNNHLKYTLRYTSYRSGRGEAGSIDLAIKYEYKL